MGAGAGAAAAIENEPSPRRAAIEKAQAELRREVAVREERRRELEFLEKGGEPLDFFTAAISAFPPFSPTDPLADQLVSSEAEGGYASIPLANGDSLENSVGTSCFVGRGSEGVGDHRIGDDGTSTASESLASPWEGKFRAPRTGSTSLRSSHADVNLKRESESSSGARTIVGKYTRRHNRQRSNRFSNGFTQPTREVEKAVESSSTPSFELKGPSANAAAAALVPVEASEGNETMVEKNVRPLLVHLDLPNTTSGNNNKISLGNTTKATANDHQEGSSLSLVKLPADQNFLKHALPNANAGVDVGRSPPLSSDPTTVDDCVILSRNSDVKDFSCTDFNVVKEDLLIGADSERLDPLPLAPCLGENVGVREGSALSQPLNLKQVSCNNPAALDKEGSTLPVAVKDESIVPIMVREKSSVSSQSSPHTAKSECKNKSPIRIADSQAQRVLDRGTTMPSSHVRDSLTAPLTGSIDDKRFVQLEGPAPLQVTSMSLESSENRGNNTRKTASTASTDAVNLAKSDNRLMPNDKALEASRVQVKIEEVSEAGTRLSGVEMEAQSGHGHDVKSICVITLPQEEVKLEGQSTPVSQGSNRTGFRTPSSLTASNKFPGVVLPWEKEKDPLHIAEAERHKANLSAKARKAHEEYIIEEAGLIQARKSDASDWGNRQAELQPMRRKCHWDFLLEEMKWMANDFMQERLWKTASASQFCRWIAQIKGQPEFQVTDLERRQKKICRVLSNSVKEFWRTMESTLSKDKRQAFPAVNSRAEEIPGNVRDDGEAVPMEVDQPLVGEASTQQQQPARQRLSKRSLPVQEYAKQFLRTSRGTDCNAHAEAPSTPDRISESSSSLGPLWEDIFPEEPLYYTVPEGACEVYRHSVEAQRALTEAEFEQTLQEHAAALAEAEANAAAEAVATSEFMVVDEGQSLTGLSSPMKGIRGDDDGAQYSGLPHSGIAKKKRKNILKSTPKVEGSLPSSGLSRPSGLPFVEGFGSGESLPSPVVTAKRSLPTTGSNPASAIVGSIPTKRMRSGTARQRPLGTASPSSFPGSAGGLTNRTTFSSGALNSNHEEGNNMSDRTIATRTEGDAAPPASKNVIGGGSNNNSFMNSKSKKKKKTKHFSGALGSNFKVDGAASGNTASSLKPVESDHHSMYDQLKRKGEQMHSGSLEPATGGIGSSAETPETPASQGQPPSKKAKLSKQASDINSDTATASATVPAAQAGSVTANTSSSSKLLRQNSNRDRNRKSRSNKVSVSQPAGIGIPWSQIEDQAILALVHDLGANWELVSDVLSSSSQLKGIFRRPKQCKERHKALMERLAVAEGGDSPDDPSTSQPHPSTLPGIPKGSARVLLQRLQGPMEEDTLKVHLEHIVRVVHKFKALKQQPEEQKLLPPHPSHLNTVSQFSNSGLSGGFSNPVELIKKIREVEKQREEELAGMGQSYQMPGHLPGGLPPGSGVRPATNGMPVLPGAGNLHVGGVSALAPSNVAVNAARDVHRLAAMRPFSPEEAQRVRYAQAMAARRLPGAPVTAGLPMMALPTPNDCAVPMLAAGNSVGMMGGLSRGMSLSRAGLSGMGSPGVSGMGSPTLGTMLPPGGVGMVGAAAGSSVGPTGVPSQVNSMRRPRDQMGRPVRTSEEQRLFIELQHQAAQGNTEAQTHLNTLNRDPSNPLIPAPSQTFPSPQHPSHQQQQQFMAARIYKERQQLQQQHKQRLLQQQLQQSQTSLPLPLQQQQQQQQLHALSQQHALPPQQATAHMQQHLQQQLALQQQQQGAQQPGLPLPSSPMQAMASPSMPSNHHHQQQQQHQALSQPQQQPQPQQQAQQAPGQQVPQLSAQSKAQQPKQSQKHQHLQQQQQQSAQALQQQQQQLSRGSKGVARGSMMMQQQQPLLPQPGQAGLLPGNQLAQQLPAQALSHSMPGQRPLQPQVPMPMGKQLSQGGVPQGGMAVQAQQNQAAAGSAPSPGSGGQQQQQQQKALQQPSQLPQLAPKQQQQQQQASPSLHHSHNSQQSPSAATPGLPAQPQQLSPSSQQPQIAAPSQQQQPRRQPQQQNSLQQSGQRRLQQQQRQSGGGSNLGGAQVPAQLVKNGTSLQSQMSPQTAAQSGHAAYPIGTSVAGSMSMVGTAGGAASGIAPLGNANSPSGMQHATQWKPGQNVPPMSTGIYNLTRTGNSGTAMPSIVNSAAMHMASPNGGSSSSSSSGMPSSSIHGLNVSGLPQSHQMGGQKVGMGPGANSRPMTAAATAAQGAQRPLQQQQQQQHHGGNLPVPLAMGGAAGQVKPPPVPPASSSGVMMPVAPLGGSGAAAGVPQSGSMAFQGSSPPPASAGHSAPMGSNMPPFGVQARQSALTTAAVLQKSAASAAAASSSSSGVSASSPASVMSPSNAPAAAAAVNSTVATDQTTSS